MPTSDFPLRLKRIKSELLALKTSHLRGLGVVDFNNFAQTFNLENEMYVMSINIDDEGLYPPFLQVATNPYSEIRFFVDDFLNPDARTLIAYVYPSSAGEYIVTATCSAKITNISMEKFNVE